MRKQKHLLFLWLLLVIPLLVAFSPPHQEDDIQLQIEIGYDGYYRPGDWTPVRVTVQSDGQSIRGFVRVKTYGTALDNTGDVDYQSSINLDRRTGEATLYLYAVIPSELRQISVELVQEDGEVLVEQTTSAIPLYQRDSLFVVITESLAGSIDMKRTPIGRGESYQSDIRLEELPDEANALEAITALALYDVDTSDLSVEQREALRDWVASGGHLLIFTGASWQQTTAGLTELLPATVAGTVTVGSMEALGEYLHRPEEVLQNSAVLARLTPNDSSTEIIITSSQNPVLVRQEYGGGRIELFAFDPMDEPFKSYKSLPMLWYQLTTIKTPTPSWSSGFVPDQWGNADRAVRIASNFSFPTVLQLLGFLAIYVVLVGPVNYIILRQIRRLEWAWITIPLLIIGFTSFAYFAGFSLRGNQPTINHLNVIQVWDNTEVAQVNTVVGIFSPRRTTYDVEATENFSLRPLPYESNDLLINSFEDKSILINEGEKYGVAKLPVDAGIVTSFTGRGYIPTIDYTAAATWWLNDNIGSNNQEIAELRGYFSSEIALEDAILLTKDSAIILGDLNANERKEFDFQVILQEPAWATLGNGLDSGYNYFYSGRTGRPLYGTYNSAYGLVCPTTQDIGTLVQIMLPYLQDCKYLKGFEDSELQIRTLFLQSAMRDIDFSLGRGDDVYVVGWSDEAPFAFSLTDQKADVSHRSLYIFRINAGFRGNENRVRIPPGLMTWTSAGRDSNKTRKDVSPYNIVVTTVEQAVLRFVPVGELQQVQVDTLELSLEVNGTSNALEISLYNWDTGEWDKKRIRDINSQADFRLTNADATPYIGADNAVEVRVVVLNDFDYVTVSRLEVSLYGTLDN